MNYKKLYEESLEKAKQGLPIDEVFPELKEGKDERIRKKLTEIIGYFRSRGIDQQFCEECLAYLERQKEQKDYRKLYEDIAQSEWFKKAYVGKSLGEGFEQKEQPAGWSEEDIKKIRSEEYTKGFNDAAFGGKLKEWSEEDEDAIEF